MHFLLRATVLGAVSALSHAESNPTHYGLPSELGGQCQDDERDSAWDSIVLKLVRHMPTFYTCNAVHPKSSDDCPTDTPEGATESVSSAFFSPQDPDVWICGKTCLRDADCGGGANCILFPQDFIPPNICGYFKPIERCLWIKSISGAWKVIATGAGNGSSQTVTYEQGVSRAYNVSSGITWGAKVEGLAKEGFNILNLFGVPEVRVSGDMAAAIAVEFAATFSMTKTETHSFTSGPGAVWQWKFIVTDGCGTSVASRIDFATTDNVRDGPCCLPGHFKDPTKPRGSCLEGSPDLCASSEVDDVSVLV